jgi:beta-glucanase (GH16 family)
VQSSSLYGEWHTFGTLWTPFAITWYLDDRPVNTVAPFADDPASGASSNQLMVLYLQEATGGWMGGTDATTPGVLDLQVDWVRIWQDANGTSQN